MCGFWLFTDFAILGLRAQRLGVNFFLEGGETAGLFRVYFGGLGLRGWAKHPKPVQLVGCGVLGFGLTKTNYLHPAHGLGRRRIFTTYALGNLL